MHKIAKIRRLRITLVLAAVTLVVLAGDLPSASAGSVYDAVADFSISSNPNGQWSYFYDNGSGPQLLPRTQTDAYGATGLDAWWTGLSIPQYVKTAKNTTGSTVHVSTLVLPTNLLAMDPEEEKSDTTRWTAPTAGTWSISGLFQGIDTSQVSHNVEILENSTIQILAPTRISSFGQQVTFDAAVTLAQGDTIDFLVLGQADYFDLSTGLSATIQLSSVPEPSSLFLSTIAGATLGLAYLRSRHRNERKQGRS